MRSKETGNRDGLVVVGLDIGKDTFHLVGFDGTGQVALRKQVKRLSLKATFEKLPRCVVGMEACMSAHFVSRALRELGFEPRIIPAIYVKPFTKGRRTILMTPKRSPRLPCGQICGPFRRRARTSLIFRPCIAFGRGSLRDGQPR